MSEIPTPPPRPPTPQVLLHRLPDLSDDDSPATRRPSKYIVLITGSTAVAGKVQIARDVSSGLGCALYQGDSMHESCAKAAAVGAARHPAAGRVEEESVRRGGGVSAVAVPSSSSGANETRYRRMWLSKLTRTGLLFPEESRPATEGFSGFGGASSSSSSTSTSRRGSASSVASATSSATSNNPAASATTAASSVTGSWAGSSAASAHAHAHAREMAGPRPAEEAARSEAGAPGFPLPEQERRRRGNKALMVLTHPELERWHKLAIRSAVGEYGIGVIFVPLYSDDADEEDDGLPVLRPLDPASVTGFPASFEALAKMTRVTGNLYSEMKLRINVDADVEGITAEILDGARDMMGIDE